jgi:uncharacterized protein
MAGKTTPKVLLIIAACVLAVVFYSWQIEPDILAVNTVEIKNSFLKTDCTILLMADLHLPLRKGIEEKLFTCLDHIKPDLILIGGDFSGYRTKADFAIEKLKAISAYGETIMVMGNTDQCGSRQCVYCSLKYPKDNLKDFPVRILRNEVVFVPKYNITIFGLDDPVTGQNDTTFFKEMKDTNYNVLLVHSIYKLKENQKNRFNLVLSGHTHGGQIVFLRPFVHWFDYMIEKKYINGIFPIKKGLMIVTKGVGESVLPVRLGVVPEVNVIKVIKGGG